MKKIAYSACLVGLLLICSCKSLEQIVNSSVQKPTISYQSFSIGSGSNSNLVLKPVFLISNSNGFAVPIDKLAYQLSFNGAKMLDGTSSQIGNIPANGSRPVELEVPLNSEVFRSFKELLLNNKKLDYAVSGNVQVLGFSIPFQKSDTLHRPSFSLEKMNVNGASFSEVNLGMVLKIDNPNSFSIPLKDMSYSVSTKNKSLFSGNLPTMDLKQGANEINLPITIHPSQLFSNVLSLMGNPELPLAISVNSPFITDSFNYNLNLRNLL